jgi:MFS family permease
MPLEFSPRLSRWGSWFPLAVLVIVTLVASVNRQLVGLIAQSVKVEFGLSDTQIGTIGSIVGLVGAILAPLLGQLTDRTDRHRLLFVAILTWSFATVTYGMAAGFIALAISFTLLATAEATLPPISNSLIGGQYSGERRINANLIYFAAGALTSGFGSFSAGLILHWAERHSHWFTALGPSLSPWRTSMLVVGAVGIPLAVLVASLGQDGRRLRHRRMNDFSDLADYWRDHRQALISFNISNSGYFIAATAIMGWMPMYLLRHYGLSPAELGTRMGVVIGIADILGIVAGLFAVKKLYSYFGPIAPRYIFQTSVVLIAILTVGQMATTNVWQALILLGCQNFLATFGTASFNNMIQDISTPEIRGKVSGINNFFVALACIPGPLVVGLLSDSMGTNGAGLLHAIILISVPALLFSACFTALSNSSFMKTVNAMREYETKVAST